jgi:quercetin dioxygenase-like cupin family protein
MKATSEETGGAFTLIEDRVVGGKATPLHSHPHLDETIYMLDGEMRMHVDGEEHMIGKQGVIFAARGVPHAFMITSDTAHLLVLQTPGSGEDFYRAASEPLTSADDATGRPISRNCSAPRRKARASFCTARHRSTLRRPWQAEPPPRADRHRSGGTSGPAVLHGALAIPGGTGVPHVVAVVGPPFGRRRLSRGSVSCQHETRSRRRPRAVRRPRPPIRWAVVDALLAFFGALASE